MTIQKDNWPSDSEIIEFLKTGTQKQLAAKLGVTQSAVSRRLKYRNLYDYTKHRGGRCSHLSPLIKSIKQGEEVAVTVDIAYNFAMFLAHRRAIDGRHYVYRAGPDGSYLVSVGEPGSKSVGPRGNNRERCVTLPDNDELTRLVSVHGYSGTGAILGCSEASVRRHCKIRGISH